MIQGQSPEPRSLESLLESFPIDKIACEITPNVDISPAQEVYAIIRHKGENWLDKFHWGLVPYWVADISKGSRLINARLETIADKPSFREAFRNRRCLIPSDGFYEWQSRAGRKRPIFITLPNRRPFAFAGIWESWTGEDRKRPIYKSCSIITTRSVKAFRPYHHRMPVILKPKLYEYWLDTKNRKAIKLIRLLKDGIVTELISQRFLTDSGPLHEDGTFHKKKTCKHRQLNFAWPDQNKSSAND